MCCHFKHVASNQLHRVNQRMQLFCKLSTFKRNTRNLPPSGWTYPFSPLQDITPSLAETKLWPANHSVPSACLTKPNYGGWVAHCIAHTYTPWTSPRRSTSAAGSTGSGSWWSCWWCTFCRGGTCRPCSSAHCGGRSPVQDTRNGQIIVTDHVQKFDDKLKVEFN